MRTSPFTRVTLAAAVGAAGAAGCDGCERDKPYTPFAIASVAPSSSSEDVLEPVDASAEPKKTGLTKKLALVARPPAARWRLEGRALQAPKGRLIERGLLHDFDADGTPEALVWTLPAEPGGAPGELFRIDPAGNPPRLFSLPSFVPSGPGCSFVPELAVTGKTTASLDVRAKCSVALLSRAPTRSLTVLAPARAAPIIVTLRVVDPSPSAPLALGVDSSDRDADGQDDLALRLSVQYGGRTQSAQFVWLDRASGAARDVAEPLASFTAAAGRARYAARRAKSADTSILDVAALRLLIATACAEGEVPRIVTAEGSALGCGKLQTLLDDIATTEVTAALTHKDLLGAFAAQQRASWYIAKPSAKAAAAIEKRLLAAVTAVPARMQTAGVTVPPQKAPGFLAIRFDAGGELWALTTTGPRQIAKDGAAVASEDGGDAKEWPQSVTRKDGATLSRVLYACDRPGVTLSFTKKDGQLDATDTGLLAPIPGGCRPNSTFQGPAALALGTKDDQPMLLLGASWVGPIQSFAEATLRETPGGTPRSPNGKYLAAVTGMGVLVQSVSDAALWQADGLTGQTGLGCSVNNDASQLACTTATGRVLLLSK